MDAGRKGEFQPPTPTGGAPCRGGGGAPPPRRAAAAHQAGEAGLAEGTRPAASTVAASASDNSGWGKSLFFELWTTWAAVV